MRREISALTFQYVPFRGSFNYNSSDYQFYCFICMLRVYAMFQAFGESIIQGLGQNFRSAEVLE
ncbi:hypothetical protein HanIR_Chr07g0314091 [Helianthus annuus]|nr:hypothetical protein HanIR_Chr07g0314091 [Helianthus annuus]